MKRRAQVLIMVGIVLALLILSVSVSLYAAGLEYQQYRKSTYDTQITNLKDDFSRVLTHILSLATNSYNQTADITLPRVWADGNFSQWALAAAKVYELSGLQVKFGFDNITIQPKEQWQGAIYTNNSLFKLYWYRPQSLSVIEASYQANLSEQGLYGINQTTIILLNMTLNVASFTNSNSFTSFSLHVNREYGTPVNDLSAKNFQIDYYDTQYQTWEEAKIVSVQGIGGGNYNISFQTLENGPVNPTVLNKTIVWCEDNRGILVESYSYTHIQYVFQENAINPFYPGSAKPNEVYTMESISNGSVMWFDKLIKFKGAVPDPIPIPPVKQLRVYTNATGSFKQTPSQVEVWTPNYQTPTLSFANWRTRFDIGDKLVYFVSFAGKNVNKVAVNITWLSDADVQPPVFLISSKITPNLLIMNNSQYTIGLVVNNSLSTWIDYNIQVNGTNSYPFYNQTSSYHVEYTLFGYDVYNGNWYPSKIPWGTGPNQGWIAIIGPVRSVFYRVSNLVYQPPTGKIYTNDFNHTEIILVPYNVSYFEVYFTATALSNVQLSQQYVEEIGLISGTVHDCSIPNMNSISPCDSPSPYRLYWGSLQQLKTNGFSQQSVITGAYYNNTIFNFCSEMHILADNGCNDGSSAVYNYGYWVAEYGNYRGQAIFIDNSTLLNLRNSPNSALWAWTTYDGARRVLEYDYAYTSSNSLTIPKGTVINYNFAGWIYLGGHPTGQSTTNNNLWANQLSWGSSTGANDPSMYYRMFLSNYYPTVISSSSG